MEATTDARERATLRRTDHRPPAFAVDTVELDFDLREGETTVRAELAVRRRPGAGPRDAPLVLDGVGLETRRVELDGVELAPGDREETEHTLTLRGVPDRFALRTEVALRPDRNTELVGLYRSGTGYFTDLEPTGFRHLTWFPDRPNVLARYRTRIEADRARFPVLLSNGHRVDGGEAGGGRHFSVWEDPVPKPCYLFALVAGDLRRREGTFTTRSGREVRLEVWTEPRDVARSGHALACLQRAMRWDEERFGREYDLDLYMIVAVGDFNGGAMENKGLNVFHSRYVLADPETATDEDYEGIEKAVGHEYFHNWTGNRVTLRDWFQLTLKEGLTVYRDQEFSAESTTGPVERIGRVRKLRELQLPQDDGPTAHPVRPDAVVEVANLYTATVYDKGAEVVRMVATLLGREGFRRGMDLYFERHDGQAVTCDDFLAAMADASGADLGRFARWYGQSGTPVVTVAGEADPAARTFTLRMRQELPPGRQDPGPLVVPVRAALLAPDGEALPLRLEGDPAGDVQRERVLRLEEREQEFRFLGVDVPVVPSLLRGFSAPVRCVVARTRAELGFLATRDSDPFARWDACQELLVGAIVELARAGGSGAVDPVLAATLGEVLADDALDGSLRALLLDLPDEGVVAQRLDPFDPEAIHRARRRIEEELAGALSPRLEEARRRADDGAPYATDRASIGCRRLKNVALRYLCAGGGAEALAGARRQLETADNMTDSLAALGCLVDAGGRLREEALAGFHARWRREPLVLDKWFAVQAASSAPDTFERVVALAGHPDFSLRNPNRMLALLSTFAHRNPARFHRPDGAAYAFLAERIVAVDAVNPRSAARLARAFAPWRRLEPGRRAAAEAVLRDLAAARLSSNAREIVERTLAPPPEGAAEAARR